MPRLGYIQNGFVITTILLQITTKSLSSSNHQLLTTSLHLEPTAHSKDADTNDVSQTNRNSISKYNEFEFKTAPQIGRSIIIKKGKKNYSGHIKLETVLKLSLTFIEPHNNITTRVLSNTKVF